MTQQHDFKAVLDKMPEQVADGDILYEWCYHKLAALEEAISYAENEERIDGNVTLAFDWIDLLTEAARERVAQLRVTDADRAEALEWIEDKIKFIENSDGDDAYLNKLKAQIPICNTIKYALSSPDVAVPEGWEVQTRWVKMNRPSCPELDRTTMPPINTPLWLWDGHTFATGRYGTSGDDPYLFWECKPEHGGDFYPTHWSLPSSPQPDAQKVGE